MNFHVTTHRSANQERGSRMKKHITLQIAGLAGFIISGLFFTASALKNGDMLSLAGCIVWIAACAIWLVAMLDIKT
jgi:hypothetical protein